MQGGRDGSANCSKPLVGQVVAFCHLPSRLQSRIVGQVIVFCGLPMPAGTPDPEGTPAQRYNANCSTS